MFNGFILSCFCKDTSSKSASIRMIDEETIWNYKNSYEKGGINELLKNNHKGSESRLSVIETEELIFRNIGVYQTELASIMNSEFELA